MHRLTGSLAAGLLCLGRARRIGHLDGAARFGKMRKHTYG